MYKLLYESICINCNKQADLICKDCKYLLPLIDVQVCPICEKSSYKGYLHLHCLNEGYPTQVVSVFNYSQIVREVIRISKYKRRYFSYLYKLLNLSIDPLLRLNLDFSGFEVVPIPLSKVKLKSRGFNQADLIAQEYAKSLGLPRRAYLKRSKNTSSQFLNSKHDRYLNLSNAFVCRQNLFGKKILLVDDIVTSGATLLTASKLLYSKGVTEVKCLTLSRSFKGNSFEFVGGYY
jgi:competence protein ComFC